MTYNNPTQPNATQSHPTHQQDWVYPQDSLHLQSPLKQSSAPTIGVVVPIYNVAAYLRRCLDSILAQTYKDFYILLVDDGSTDTSLAIAKEYVARDERFVLFSKPNQGQSSARNVGIEFFARKYEHCLLRQIGGGGSTRI